MRSFGVGSFSNVPGQSIFRAHIRPTQILRKNPLVPLMAADEVGCRGETAGSATALRDLAEQNVIVRIDKFQPGLMLTYGLNHGQSRALQTGLPKDLPFGLRRLALDPSAKHHLR